MSKIKKQVQELAEIHKKIVIVESLINEARRKLYKKHGKALKALKERKRTLERDLFKI